MSTTLILFSSLILFIATFCSGGCIESERDALLQFKSSLSDPSKRLSDWDVANGSDYYRWTGVVCHNITFHVLELKLRTLSQEEYFRGYDRNYNEYEEYYRKSAMGGKLNSSLLGLKHLRYLDLSYNEFGDVPIPQFIGSMQSLRYLNLSRAGFRGIIPPELGNLSNLQYLNLHSTYINRFPFGTDYGLNVENLNWVSSLSSLEFLDMSGVDLSRSVDWFKVISPLSFLSELHLSQCSLPNINPTRVPSLNSSFLSVLDLSGNDFEGPLPNSLQNMTSSFLRELDLSWNYFSSSIPNWLYDLTDLQHLNLGHSEFQGQIVSSGIGNLTSLISLDMSYNHILEFENRIPNSFKNLCYLTSLDLSFVKMNQEINDVLAIMSSGCVSDVIQSLHLGDCELSGHLTDDLSYFRNLTSFRIYDNSISGPIPSSLGQLNSLAYLDLKNNRLSGTLPVSFGDLKQLREVYISNNKMEGEVSHLHFANLTKLTHFEASRNNIALRVSSNWIPPLQLDSLGLGSWQIGSHFPKWLRLLKHLTYLNLSNSGISSPIPTWFRDSFSKYDSLKISENQMHGFIPNFIPFTNKGPVIDLSSNNLNGAIPYFSSNVEALDLSKNSFSGSIFNFLCYKMNEEKQMQILNFESNLLHGEIPDCWMNWKHMGAIKLSNNKFDGNIPNSIETLSGLQSLNLRNNNLSGEIPWQIQNCKYLSILDFSQNSFVGK